MSSIIGNMGLMPVVFLCWTGNLQPYSSWQENGWIDFTILKKRSTLEMLQYGALYGDTTENDRKLLDSAQLSL